MPMPPNLICMMETQMLAYSQIQKVNRNDNIESMLTQQNA